MQKFYVFALFSWKRTGIQINFLVIFPGKQQIFESEKALFAFRFLQKSKETKVENSKSVQEKRFY
jgi:hypothetical protein